jgi:hypothetical protein
MGIHDEDVHVHQDFGRALGRGAIVSFQEQKEGLTTEELEDADICLARQRITQTSRRRGR